MSELLENIINHACKTVPYYQKNYQQAVKEWVEKASVKKIESSSSRTVDLLPLLPLLEKKDIVWSPEQFWSVKYQTDLLANEIDALHTSGSTGKCIDVHWYKKDMVRSLTELWYYRKKYYKIHPRDRCCYFYSISDDPPSDPSTAYDDQNPMITYHHNGRLMGICKEAVIGEELIGICRAITGFQPRYMLLQPSIALLLALCYQNNDLPIPTDCQYIELTGEYLFPEVREAIAAVFQCAICNQYGCIEANCIASECREGNLHIHTSNVCVE
ncbi:MAG: hypothetical protein LBV33_02950, partial [Lachnospiraceae bacterium]|nr:hypothetical protein [Lachnospiraceae bacterium]